MKLSLCETLSIMNLGDMIRAVSAITAVFQLHS